MVNLIDKNGILEVPDEPKYNPDPMGFGIYYFNKMKKFSDEIAQVYVETKKSDTYGDILTRSIRVALHMKKIGIQKEDVISLCTDLHPDTCIPFWAAMFSGIKIANIDPSLAQSDLKHLTNIVKPKLIFCVPRSVEVLENVIKELNLNTQLVVFGETTNHILFKEFLNSHDGEQEFKPRAPENINDTLCILFSSGTTGLPKGVCLSHFGIMQMVNMCEENYNFKSVLFYTGPYWISYLLILCSTVVAGGKVILNKTFVPNQVLKIVQDYEVTYLFLAPVQVYPILLPSDEKYNTSSLNTLLLGGGSTDTDLIKKLKNLLPYTFTSQFYGMTDVCGVFSSFNPRTDRGFSEKMKSSGRMFPGTICKVVDIETNKILGKNEQGELLVKTKRIMNGYYNDPDKTAEAFDEEGFFKTGDIVFYDDDYFFYVVDRIKEIFKYKSWNIIPAELEGILLQHPAVKEALVIGYPHEEDGDHPMAAIILEDNKNVSEKEILQYFNDQVTDRKKLRAGVKFVKTLPKTPTGKYSRKNLRQMIINKEI